MFSGEMRSTEKYFHFHLRKLSYYMFYSGAIKTLTCGVTGHPATHVRALAGYGAPSCVQVEQTGTQFSGSIALEGKMKQETEFL